MVEKELGGNIVLSGFDIDSDEMTVVKNMVGKYAEKLRNHGQYEQLKLEMKKHIKANPSYEINGLAIFGGFRLNAKEQGTNMFVLIDDVMKKIVTEVEHKFQKK